MGIAWKGRYGDCWDEEGRNEKVHIVRMEKERRKKQDEKSRVLDNREYECDEDNERKREDAYPSII